MNRMNLREAIKRLGVLEVLNETATPIRLNQYFNEKFELIDSGKNLIQIMETLALYCVPSNDHDKALKKIINKTKDGKGHIGVVEGDFGSGKTAFMAYLWDELENEGYMSLPPLGHADPKQIVEKIMDILLRRIFHHTYLLEDNLPLFINIVGFKNRIQEDIGQYIRENGEVPAKDF